MLKPDQKLNNREQGKPAALLHILGVALAIGLMMGSALNAQNAAAEPRFIDRLYFDVGGTTHLPVNFPAFIGGVGGFGIDMRDFNFSLTGKFSSSMVLPTITAFNMGGGSSINLALFQIPCGYCLPFMPDFPRLREVPEAPAGLIQLMVYGWNSA